ncbi:DUF4097 family beta strand repeat-containing protein [Alicyclobacillus tolerans]|uniref:SHOCT-like domain-containing protein n=1 Tax=Alicyclobacillus tolerans TaxID=90970 RepID=UPI001F321EC0|nr:DUF4097 family beta strand repeat-containing protein [Alicyclobacillus tolerans]MCF8565775.1 DUF4097 family beta strand repeat-containing protein [Alicyclobacillus tolerans]
MNERQKILELLKEEKITVEQADTLLAALEHNKTPRSAASKVLEKNPLDELKNIGEKVSSAVAQSLGEWRKTVEQQIENWPFNNNASSVMVSTEVVLPDEVENITLATSNGDMSVNVWDESYVRLVVRARVKTDSLLEGKRVLNKALQSSQTEADYELVVIHGHKDGVLGAGIDVYVPKQMGKIHLRTQNGNLQGDSVHALELDLETVNGGVWLDNSAVKRIHLRTQNGNVDLHHSLSEETKTVYVSVKNGTIDCRGFSSQLRVKGVAKSVVGRVDVTGDQFITEFEDKNRQRSVRFEYIPLNEALENDAARVQLETRHGSVRVRG